jgi:hypothetical protein
MGRCYVASAVWVWVTDWPCCSASIGHVCGTGQEGSTTLHCVDTRWHAMACNVRDCFRQCCQALPALTRAAGKFKGRCLSNVEMRLACDWQVAAELCLFIVSFYLVSCLVTPNSLSCSLPEDIIP